MASLLIIWHICSLLQRQRATKLRDEDRIYGRIYDMLFGLVEFAVPGMSDAK